VRLLASHGLRDEAIQLVVGPASGKKRRRENNDAESARSDAFIDLAAQAVSDPHLGLVTVTPREVRAFRKGIATALLSSLACDINTSHVCPDRRGARLCQCVGLWPAGGRFPDDLATAFQAHRELEVGGVVIGDVPSYRADQMPYGGVKESALGAKAFGTRWRTTHTSGFYC
jgi:hypothetical protein